MDWQTYLHGRGITGDTFVQFALGPGEYDNRPSIRYRTIGLDGGTAYRHKFIDGSKPKNKWHGTTLQRNYRYYSPGGLGAAIKAANGRLYIVSGEPDVWTLYEGMGINYATCTFGEGSVPATLKDDLARLSVQQLTVVVDLDNTGFKAAYEIRALLKDAPLQVRLLRLPGEMGSGYDLNQLWTDVKFDRAAFGHALRHDAEQISDSELDMYAPARHARQMELDVDALYEHWVKDVVGALGPAAVREGGIDRWHCPLPEHPDVHPSFRVADGDTVPMPMCSCNIQHEGNATAAWDRVALALNIDTWAQYKTRHRQQQALTILSTSPVVLEAVPEPATPEPPAPPADYSAFYVDSYDVYTRLCDQLEGRNIPDVEYVDFPLKVLHRFGGFAEIMFPGKLVYVVGVSGGGKTSLAETMGELWLRQGYDFVWYGPEWDANEMGMRALQRAGGPDVIRMAKYLMYKAQEQRGIAPDKRKGNDLYNPANVEAYKLALELLRMPGRAVYLNSDANRLPFAALLNTVRHIVDERRAQGRKVIAFFFDYLQRANRGGRSEGAFWSEEIVTAIKSLCEELQIVGIIMVQPKKNDSKSTRDGAELDESSGQGISDQQCNLYLALTPDFESGKKFAKIRVVKNSMGQVGEITVPTDFSRLLWLDKEATRTNVNLGAKGDSYE